MKREGMRYIIKGGGTSDEKSTWPGESMTLIMYGLSSANVMAIHLHTYRKIQNARKRIEKEDVDM